jgi:hypothetical protein
MQAFGGGNVKGRDHLEDLGVDGRIILRRILKKRSVGMACIELISLTIRANGGFL